MMNNHFKTITITNSDVPGIMSQIDMKPIVSPFECENSRITIKRDKKLTIDNVNYLVEQLSDKGNKGAHSLLLKLFLNDGTSHEDSQLVIKISKDFDNWTPRNFSVSKANKSFYREIDCLRKCKEQGSNYIIPIHYWGHIVCKIVKNDSVFFFPFYMMDCADCDLKQFLENNDLDKKEKVEICYQIASGLGELHTIDCYHRDIKPDNILLFERELKIGDLGLIRYRNDDIEDAKGIIGPKGWISPEAMNKYLNEEKVFDNRINTEINEQSDIFQLGM